MAVLPIIKLGHPSLHKRAEEIEEITPELHELVANMVDTMRLADGIGLAAPQVNVLKRLFVIDLNVLDEELDAKAYLNPRILEDEGSIKMEEGCLSIPDVNADVIRPEALKVAYMTLEGEEIEEEMTDTLARVFQHELDHLDGILYIDKITPLQLKLIEPELERIRRESSII